MFDPVKFTSNYKENSSHLSLFIDLVFDLREAIEDVIILEIEQFWTLIFIMDKY